MIFDASAIIAIFFKETDWQELLTALEDAESISVGAPTLAKYGT